MKTILKVPGTNRVEIYGKSTDEKPMNFANASVFYEMDTKKVFLFDAEAMEWLEQ